MKKNLLPMLVLFASFATTAQTSLMSYNIKYANENDGENSWSQRKEHLTQQLKFYEPDIVGMQEVLQEQLDHFGKELPQYESIGVAREDGKQKGEFSPILYKSDKYELLEQSTFWLSETPEKPSLGWDADYKRVCTYAKFRNKNTGTDFWVFNTHFDHMGVQARKESARLLLEKMQTINTEELPLFLMGDFNLEPDSAPIQSLLEHLKDSKATATKVSFGPEGTFNAYEFGKPAQRRIDYIFLNKQGPKVLKYAVLTDSKELKYPSDHFPVYISVDFQE